MRLFLWLLDRAPADCRQYFTGTSGTVQVSISPTFYKLLFQSVISCFFCTFFGKRKMAQKLLVKCWWNWLQSFNFVGGVHLQSMQYNNCFRQELGKQQKETLIRIFTIYFFQLELYYSPIGFCPWIACLLFYSYESKHSFFKRYNFLPQSLFKYLKICPEKKNTKSEAKKLYRL